jgi:hypothetical protein
MLDGAVRARIQPAIDAIGGAIARAGISANAVTVIAFALGVAAAALIALGAFIPA